MLVWRQPLRMAISRTKLTPPTSASCSTFTATTWTPPRSALNTCAEGAQAQYRYKTRPVISMSQSRRPMTRHKTFLGFE